MANNVINWVGFTIQVIGLLLITIELYLPALSERLKIFLESIQFRLVGTTATKQYWNWVAIGAYISIWVVSVAIVSILDPAMSIVANVAFTIFTMFLGSVIFMSKVFVRLGIELGRGNVIGGVGLVLALIGFTIEISKMVIA
ncbi:hypothetical protein [Alteromonas lipolytica]|uniref:Uncharacterized protein n=1 Tax=Alteromonas lipolytica TaxID=1856405 RepID=A0A1E8FA46_9ALTE|nr:hypothetical protein [Alteromonas lipolytica]OFI32794.1 hypothetical protein BFC17_06515 [Alteromonas lipolytica]GGF72919.1 hypothetical protein GCM10011338_26400 [Alteromonas lipolytica]